jgi:transposase-like protein
MRAVIEFDEATLRDKETFLRFLEKFSSALSESIKTHGCARTTPIQRLNIQKSQRTHGIQTALAKEYGVNPKTIKKWLDRESPADQSMGPRPGESRVITEKQEREIEAYCASTKESLDKCLIQLRKKIPELSRSTLYRIRKRRTQGSPLVIETPGHMPLHPSKLQDLA